jgi:hypothetical protein
MSSARLKAHLATLKLASPSLLSLTLFSLAVSLLWVDGLCAQVSTPTQHLNTTPALASGQAMRATGRNNSALVYNPAAMSASASYVVDASYLRSPAEENVLSLSVVDSKTRLNADRLAVGAAYAHVFTGGSTTAYEGRLGFALPVFASSQGTPELHLGAAGRYVSDELSGVDGFDLDAGALLNLGGGVHIGAVGESLLEGSRPQRFGGAVGVSLASLSVGVDVMYQPEGGAKVMSGGGELLLGERFVIRGGYERLTPKEGEALSWGSGGLALLSDQGVGQFSLAYRRSIETGEVTFGASFSSSLELP